MEPGPFVSRPALDFGDLINQFAPHLGDIARDEYMLGFKAETRPPLAFRTHAAVGDELGHDVLFQDRWVSWNGDTGAGWVQ